MKKVLLLALLWLLVPVFAEPVLRLNFSITPEGNARLVDYRVIDGRPTKFLVKGDFSIALLSEEGVIVIQEHFPISFAGVGRGRSLYVTYDFPYYENIHFVTLGFKGNELLREKLNLCVVDDICGTHETFLSCPQDCFSGTKDGFCDRIKDMRVDPDCLPGVDPDETCNKDGVCDKGAESYANCPTDCPSGAADGFCDMVDDGKCDPDCVGDEDPDCAAAGVLGFSLVGGLLVLVVVIMILAIAFKKGVHRNARNFLQGNSKHTREPVRRLSSALKPEKPPSPHKNEEFSEPNVDEWK